MNFTLVEAKWDRVFNEAVRKKRAGSRLRVICPFIKEQAARRLLGDGQYKAIEVITRFDPNCFRDRVSDIAALRRLLNAGATIKGIKNLHAKVYLVGNRAIVTSANLTEQALNRNHEFGFWSDDPTVLAGCTNYFEGLWRRAGETQLQASKLDEWEQAIEAAQGANGGMHAAPQFKDEGADVGLPPTPDLVERPVVKMAEQGFVKFFGLGNDRADPSMSVLDEVNESTSHWALSYPTTRIPRAVKDGDVMFIGRLCQGNDILIYGRAIATAYRPRLDDATAGDKRKKRWKRRWSRYIRIHDGEFINGTLQDGVSLNRLMQTLQHLAFARTKARYEGGERNIRLRGTYARQAQVRLAPEAIAWLNDEMDRRFERFGRISQDALDDLVQPEP